MNRYVGRVDDWRQTKTGLAIVGLVEFALVYVFASWAIDSGRLLAWFLAVVLLIGGIQNLVRAVLISMKRGV